MLLGALGASLLENIIAGKVVIRAADGAITKRQDRRIIRAGYGSTIKKGFLMLPHPLTNFEIQKYYSGDNLPKKIKGWTCVINLDEYSDIGTH